MPHPADPVPGSTRGGGAAPPPARDAPPDALAGDLFRLLVESVRDYAIFVLDPGGHIASWNAGAQRIKGYAPAEIVGRHFSVFYPAEDVAAGKPAWALAVAAREGRVEDEGWRVRRDGTRIWANVVITALRDPSGTLVGYAKVTRDLTERRASDARALDDARRIAAAEAANRAKSEFLAAMSHELRTPLNAIAGYTDLLDMGLRGPVTDAQRQDLERIRRSQQHLLGIINDLLNYTRLEAGRVHYHVETFSVADAVRDVAAMVEAQAAGAQLALSAGSSPRDLLVRADRAKVEQILLNLLSNAIKFTGAGGSIGIESAAGDDRVLVRVTDTGIGIPAPKLEAIFEPFVQVGRSLTHPAEGTGLGLAISRDLARAMGGDLTVESTLGRGSRFTLGLPKGREQG